MIPTVGRSCRPAGEAEPKILGYDVAGVVDAVGPLAKAFRPGDAVLYAGSVARPGDYAERHLVDERIVGPATMPA